MLSSLEHPKAQRKFRFRLPFQDIEPVLGSLDLFKFDSIPRPTIATDSLCLSMVNSWKEFHFVCFESINNITAEALTGLTLMMIL